MAARPRTRGIATSSSLSSAPAPDITTMRVSEADADVVGCPVAVVVVLAGVAGGSISTNPASRSAASALRSPDRPAITSASDVEGLGAGLRGAACRDAERSRQRLHVALVVEAQLPREPDRALGLSAGVGELAAQLVRRPLLDASHADEHHRDAGEVSGEEGTLGLVLELAERVVLLLERRVALVRVVASSSRDRSDDCAAGRAHCAR